ncbi:carboxypeptidase-like regulatory domain-containing protein [Pedobacter psychroterrae]|uniref:Carboxypeptidase regulatory-like domain-containing protein n=1 Tax=Pedobacter psychroterrae TaxID=2530453 RepID=A0A4R0NLL4_9SPHI|nr:carboxypeptidase-like regulatory domain-containing protein [Pedobacter psychroterrae]TCD00184.1 carboxypeptidase regulatory-like domain-containing protein [Pedobacter psychroterrae]
MKNKRALLFSLLVSVISLLAFIPLEDGGIEKLVASLQHWTDTNPQEKVHLHMDKPYYALGDTIWFKAYVTVGSKHQLSAQSQAMYVELISEQDSLIQTLKLPVIAGLGMGDFTLDDDLNEGNYRIRAYTQWMRNAGEDYFFDKTFTVGSPGGEGVVAKVDCQYELVKDKPMVMALLNYKDDEGKPLSEEEVRYEVILNNKVIYTKALKTDASGSMSVSMANDAAMNAGSGFLRTTIYTKGKRKVIKTFPIKAALSKSDVQFFPEGGTLVSGVISRIGFKAVGMDGAGVPVKGVVLDNLGQEVISFDSQHAGIGSFVLKPEAGKQYKAKIIYQDSSEALLDLPVAQQEGYTLSVYQIENDSLLVRVSASAGLSKSPRTLALIAQSGGETVYASKVTTSKQINSVLLPKKSFPTGIAQFTLFDDKNEPISERIVFVRNPDQMTVSVKTSKKSYKSREKVELELESSDPTGKPVAGSFSVSVIDESKVPVEESMERTIFSNILLTSDLKGYIEKPNYYFTADNDTVNKALDNLMLTQGYRRFSWKEISKASPTEMKPLFKAESLGMEISGKVLTLGNDPLPNGKVTLMSLRSGILRDTVTDALGRFSFQDMVLTDSIRFAVQARTEKKGKKVEIVLDTVPKINLGKNRNLAAASTNISGILTSYLDNVRHADKAVERMGGLSRVQRLNEVVIRARKLKNTQFSAQGMYKIPEGHADQTFLLENANACASLGICLQGRLAGVNFLSNGIARSYPHSYVSGKDGGWKPMQVFVDGRRMETDIEVSDVFDNNVIDPTDIGKIDVVRTNRALITLLGGPSILIITKNGYLRKRYDPSIVNIRPKGYNKVREFYSPKYDYNNNASPVPDLRSTIYWNANVKTHGLGKTTLSYYNADGPGTYKVIVEGINAAGELARTVYRYEVEQATSVVQAPVDHTNSIVASLDSLHKRLPGEKVYVHTDKHYYNLGDTLWFKAYLMNAASFTGSSRSGLLYVEMTDDSTEIVRRISIPVSKGLGWAQIPLPRKIFHEGAYTLRAYTNWMQNFGDDYIFKKRIYLARPSVNKWLAQSSAKIVTVEDKDQLEVAIRLRRLDDSPAGRRNVEVKIYVADQYISKQELMTTQDGELKFSSKLKDKVDGANVRVVVRSLHKNDGSQLLQVPLKINRTEKIDLQFMPEGGQLVAGLKSAIAFKAIAEDGKGTDIAGEIYDSAGQKVSSFTSLHNGMGSLDFVPKSGEIYTAKITKPEATEKSYSLPLINAAGTILHVANKPESDSVQVSISASAEALNPDSVFYLTATSRGKMLVIQQVDLNKTSFSFPKSSFPTGITRFSLLKGKRPLNERIIFIDHKDQLDIKITPGKLTFGNRETAELLVEVKDKSGVPVKGNFSLAVTDDSQVKRDSVGNYSIAASLLLNSDLKGTVENPGYYLNGDDGSLPGLDNLMLTQGWTGYDWSNVFLPATEPKFLAEKEFKIMGQVTNILKKPVKGANMLISSQKPSFITTTVTDSLGVFEFKELPQIDSGSFFIQARTPKGRSMNFGGISVSKFEPAPVPPTFRDQLIPWYVNSDTVQLNYVQNFAIKTKEEPIKQEGISLNEVKIVASKIIKGSFNKNGPGKADLVFDERDIKESGVMNLWELIKQKLPGIRVVKDEGVPALLYNEYLAVIEIDGVGLPMQLNEPPKADELKAAISEFQIANMVGMEVMYSRKYVLNKYAIFRPGSPDAYPIEWRDDNSYLVRRANGPNKKDRSHAVIGITTLNKTGWHINGRPDWVTLRPLPIMKPQEFYSPKYTIKNIGVKEPDLRSVIFWEPNIVTDGSGRAKVIITTADIPGTYSVSVEGSDMSGSIGSGTGKVKVNPVSSLSKVP